jgi:hypothetical protein
MGLRISKKKNIVSLEFPCRKRTYHTLRDAEDMIRHISETRVTREIRAYQCPVCGFWHLTSRGK